MKQLNKHTDLPWAIRGLMIKNKESGQVVLIDDSIKFGDAEFIVEACNNYYRLKADRDSYKESYENLKEENERLMKVMKGIERFLPSLRTCVDKEFQFPDTCINALDAIESVLQSKPQP
jgi:hypothetical protein